MNYIFSKVKSLLISWIKRLVTCDCQVYIVRDYEGRITIIYKNTRLSQPDIEDLKKKFSPWLGSVVQWTGPKGPFSEPLLDEIRQSSEVFKSEGVEIFWNDRLPHLGSWFSKLQPRTNHSQSRILTFYSYKGGVGRSTLAAAVACELSSQNHRVILIDADLEAPGISWYFYPTHQFADENNPIVHTPGLVDFLSYYHCMDLAENQAENFDIGKFINIESFLFGNDHRFPNCWLMSSGYADYASRDVSEYAQAVGRVNFNLHSKRALQQLIDLLNQHLNPSFIIFDARTGITDIGGLLNCQLTDFSVFVGYPDDQSQAGLNFFAKHLKMEKDENENWQLPAIWVHSPAQMREGALDMAEHDHFVKQVVDSLAADSAKPEPRELIREILEEGEFVVDIPQIEDVRPILRRAGINELKSKTLLWEYYREVTRIILQKTVPTEQAPEHNKTTQPDTESPFEKIVKELKNSEPLFAVSDAELIEKEGVRRDFFPLDEFRMVFDGKRFMVLGNKGTGKTTLERVLNAFKSQEDQKNLARVFSAGYDDQAFGHRWLSILGAENFRVFNLVADELKGYNNKQLKAFWTLLITQTLRTGTSPAKEMISAAYTQAENANALEIGNLLDEVIQNQSGRILLTFDRLDDAFKDTDVRRSIINALVEIWWGMVSTPGIKVSAKIFYRLDLFKQDVSHPNKGHIQSNNSFSLRWSFEEVMAAVLKRLIARSETLLTYLEDELGQKISHSDLLGYIPPKDEAWIRKALRRVFGQRITQPYAEVWFRRYLRDGNGNYFPRFIFNLTKRLIESSSQAAPEAVFRTYKTIREFYWEISEQHLENEFLEMYPDLKPLCSAVQGAPGKVKSSMKKGPEFLKFLEEVMERNDFKQMLIDQPHLSEILKTSENLLTRMMDTGLVDRVHPDKWVTSQIRFPDIYRVPLGISVANGLPPKRRQ